MDKFLIDEKLARNQRNACCSTVYNVWYPYTY